MVVRLCEFKKHNGNEMANSFFIYLIQTKIIKERTSRKEIKETSKLIQQKAGEMGQHETRFPYHCPTCEIN